MPRVVCSTLNHVEWNWEPNELQTFKSAAHIWRLQIFPHTHLTGGLVQLLDKSELIRADSYHYERDRTRFMLSRGILRNLAAAYTGQVSTHIQLPVGKNKKPLFLRTTSGDIHYNLAHAGDFIIFAFAGAPVGVDVEYIDGDFPFKDVVQDYFNTDEIKFLEMQPSPQLAFYKLWTRKEALVKATGKGMDNDVRLVPALDGSHNIMPEWIGSQSSWNVKSFEVSQDHPAAIACDSSINSLLFFDAESFFPGRK